MEDITNHNQNSKKKLQLLLANIFLEDMVKNSVWSDEYFADCDIEATESAVASYTSGFYNTTFVYGFTDGPNIDRIIESFSSSELKNISANDLQRAKDYTLVNRRIFRLSNVPGITSYASHRQHGYCILSGKKILAAEVGIEVQDSTKLLREIATLKGEISQQKSKIVELESEIQISRSTLQDKEAVLAGRANLTWS